MSPITRACFGSVFNFLVSTCCMCCSGLPIMYGFLPVQAISALTIAPGPIGKIKLYTFIDVLYRFNSQFNTICLLCLILFDNKQLSKFYGNQFQLVLVLWNLKNKISTSCYCKSESSIIYLLDNISVLKMTNQTKAQSE